MGRDKSALRKQRAYALARQDILAAALELFNERGFQATRMSDIGKNSGFTASSLYTYFDSKNAILEALIEGFTVELLDTVNRPLPVGDSLAERLRLTLLPLWQLVAKRRQLFRFFIRLRDSGEGYPLSDGPAEEDPRVVGHLRNVALLTSEREAGRLRQDLDVESLATMLGGIQEAMMIKQLGGQGEMSYESTVDSIVTMFCHGAQPSTAS